MARADLTGRRYGRLLVLGEDPTPYRSPQGKPTRRWRCRCDCGREVVVLQSALTGKRGTRSCGCAQREAAAAQAIDLTGQRYGRLTVLRRADLEAPTSNGTRHGWLCRCDCGNTVLVEQRCLASGDTLSCGCLHRERLASNAAALDASHIDGTSISTLRSTKPRSTNKLGVRGVYWSTREQQYIAHITIRGRSIKRRCGRDLDHAIRTRQELYDTYAQPIIDAHKEDTPL